MIEHVRNTILTWSRTSGLPFDIRERAAIANDGTVWLWVQTAADAARADTFGTYRVTATGEQVAAAERLAVALAARPAGPAVDAAIVTTIAGSGFVHVTAGGLADGELAEAIALAETLTVAALAAPHAVARLEARPPGEVGPGAAIDLGVVLRNAGSDAISMAFEREAFVVRWLDGERHVATEEPGEPPIGLISQDGRLLDGLYGTAVIAAGGLGALTIPVSVPAEPVTAVTVSIRGEVLLLGPWPETGGAADPFSAVSAPAPLQPPPS